MGSIVEATCSCGFATRMLLGGGIRSHTTLAAFPALCPSCGTFDVVNLFDRPPHRCAHCKKAVPERYDSPSLRDEPGTQEVFSCRASRMPDRVAQLSDGTYRCPECHAFALRFKEAGCWD